MILVDTSVWVDHFRHGNSRLAQLLLDGEVMCHPFVVGELACGFLTRRADILSLLSTLPSLAVADHAEALRLVDMQRLFGRGLGWIDVHLLASAVLAKVPVWSLDKTLSRTATALGMAG
jgi:predicted nucleic acid-binding protein